MDAQKARLHDPAQRRRYFLAGINSATAMPLSRVLAAAGLSPNAVSYLSLLVSLLGVLLVSVGDARQVVAGAIVVHVGLLLDHADGQVARMRGKGSDWGMYLDMVIDRVVETGLILATVTAALRVPGTLDPLPGSWTPMPAVSVAATGILCIAAMLGWRFLNAYNDVLYLRTHLRATGQTPHAHAPTPGRGIVFNRDWVFLAWVVGTAAGQHQAVLLGLLGLHALAMMGKVRAYRLHHRDPEARAAAVLADDYH